MRELVVILLVVLVVFGREEELRTVGLGSRRPRVRRIQGKAMSDGEEEQERRAEADPFRGARNAEVPGRVAKEERHERNERST